MKVCIIDDNESITKMISLFLKKEGHETKIVNDGREGLEILEKENFDVTVLDIAMPNFSGFDILEALNKSGRIKEHKICVFTASSTIADDVEKLTNLGVMHILKKPADIQIVVSTLEKLNAN